MCEEDKISKHIKNISGKLKWRCDMEPVAIGFRIALNLLAKSCRSNIHTQIGTKHNIKIYRADSNRLIITQANSSYNLTSTLITIPSKIG